MPTYYPAIIATLALSVVLFIFVIIIGRSNFKKAYNENFSFLRNFPFEMQDNPKTNARYYLRVLVAMVFATMSIFYVFCFSDYFKFYSSSIMVVVFAILSNALLIPIFVLDVRYIKTQLFTFGGFLLSTLFQSAFLIWFCFQVPKLTTTLPIAIIAIIFAVVLIALIFNPRFKTWALLEKHVEEDGTATYKRPKVFTLAISEWIVMVVSILLMFLSLWVVFIE